jgi:hypothetical protein
MNIELIGNLVRLRYKLLWARTRTRNGKIALFFAGYLLLIFLLVIFSLGGVGAGILAVRSGKAYAVAGGVLGALYVQAMIATVLLGFGVNAVFADVELRRYPMRAVERRLTRHLIGIVDPFWILVLAIDLGLGVGLYLVGAGSFWSGVIAALLLFVSNYLVARVLALLIERMVSKPGGSALLMATIILFGILPGLAGQYFKKNPRALEPIFAVLAYTPPAGAAAAMVRSGASALFGFAVVLGWLAGLTAALVALERRPPRRKVAQITTLSFGDFWDRLGGLFGPENGPLVAQWLRYYSRNRRFRTIYPLAIPLMVFLAYTQSQGGSAAGRFATVLGCFAIVGFIGTAQFAVNQFGYLGGGFRRYFILPADPAAILRSGSYAFLLLSACLIPVGALAVIVIRPVPLSVAGFLMLIAAAVATLFFMHGLALWSTLFGPRRANFYASFGNDLSLAGNVLVIGGMLTLLFVPRLLALLWPTVLVPGNWWIMVAIALAAIAFYSISLRRAAAAFRMRRERLLAVIEGRS